MLSRECAEDAPWGMSSGWRAWAVLCRSWCAPSSCGWGCLLQVVRPQLISRVCDRSVAADLREANDHLRTLESGIASAKKRSASTATPMRSERDSLMSGRSDGTYGAGAAAAAAAPEMTSSEMRQQQELQVRQQDESFAALEEGLDTLGESAKGISAELGHQDVIIEDVSDKMRKADDSLRARSRAIVRIMQANNVCWMYITIFVLLALLVVLTATGSF